MDETLPVEIDVVQLKSLLDSKNDFLFLDCREPEEYDHCRIELTRLIPMGQIPEHLGSLEEHRNERIVVLCHHGRRSLVVTRWLRDQGFKKAQSVAGGIDQWSLQVDPGIIRY